MTTARSWAAGRRHSTSSARRTVLVALLAALSPSCSIVHYVAGDPPEDGIAVKALTADLAFGAEQAASPTAPAVNLFANLGAVGDVFLLREPLGDEEAASAPPRPASPIAMPPQACGDPDQGAISTDEATQVVKGTPRTGKYKWKVDGTIEFPGLAKLPLPRTALRELANVASAANGAVAYEYRIVSLAGNETQYLEVRPDGVYLTRLQITSGSQVIDFQPIPLLAPKLYSLPVRPGEAISAQVPDLVHGLLFTLTGQVGGRERLEGCDTVFDGWAFRGTRVLESLQNSSQSIRSTDYETWLAPQYGGVFVGEKATTQGQFGPLVYRTEYMAVLGDARPIG